MSKNKYIAFLNDVYSHPNKYTLEIGGIRDGAEGYEDIEFISIEQVSGNELENTFADVVKVHDKLSSVCIDYKLNEISFVSYFLTDDLEQPEYHEKDINVVVYSSISVDDLKLYRSLCRNITELALMQHNVVMA